MLSQEQRQLQQPERSGLPCATLRHFHLVTTHGPVGRVSAGTDVLLGNESDTPFALMMAAMEAIPALTQTEDSGFAWTMYTGDLVSHDKEGELSR